MTTCVGQEGKSMGELHKWSKNRGLRSIEQLALSLIIALKLRYHFGPHTYYILHITFLSLYITFITLYHFKSFYITLYNFISLYNIHRFISLYITLILANGHPEGPAPANDNPEWPASFKWSSGETGLLQMMIWGAAAMRGGIGDSSSYMEMPFSCVKSVSEHL